jgi:hypothetical protein
MRGQAVLCPKFSEFAPIEPVKTVLGSHPQIAGRILRDALHIQIAQALGQGTEAILLRLASAHQQFEREESQSPSLKDALQLPL